MIFNLTDESVTPLEYNCLYLEDETDACESIRGVFYKDKRQVVFTFDDPGYTDEELNRVAVNLARRFGLRGIVRVIAEWEK